MIPPCEHRIPARKNERPPHPQKEKNNKNHPAHVQSLFISFPPFFGFVVNPPPPKKHCVCIYRLLLFNNYPPKKNKTRNKPQIECILAISVDGLIKSTLSSLLPRAGKSFPSALDESHIFHEKNCTVLFSVSRRWYSKCCLFLDSHTWFFPPRYLYQLSIDVSFGGRGVFQCASSKCALKYILWDHYEISIYVCVPTELRLSTSPLSPFRLPPPSLPFQEEEDMAARS